VARRGFDVEGERETIRALEQSAAVATDPATMAAAAEMVLPVARLLDPNDTGELAASYTVSGDPPGVASPLVWAGIVEYGWPARGRPAHLRVRQAFEDRLGEIEAMIDERVEDAGNRRGL
jgi:hypothetical protein